MQIKKINDDKLKIILSSNDLDEKNIDIDSFLSNPIESQNLFFEILDIAEEKYNFDIENNKAVIEAVSLENNIFILTITKLENNTYINNTNSKIYCFENIDDILKLYSCLHKNIISSVSNSLYKFADKFYLLLSYTDKNLEKLLDEFATPINNYSFLEDVLIEYGNKLKK